MTQPDNRTHDQGSPPRLGDMSDEALIARFQGGDTGAFRFLVERYQERVRNLVHSILNDGGLVDDMAQEVFISAYQALPSFRSESRFYTWLYRITVNKCRDEIRRRKIRRFLSFQNLADEGDKELQGKMTVAPDDSQLREVIGKALQRIPERFRTPVVLKDVDGLSYQEMADVMECEIGTVKSRLSRGRAMLRDLLAPHIAS